MVRYEPSGAITAIAEKFQGKRFNSPNDIVVHPDGGVWFTDPAYGINGNYEGYKADSEMKDRPSTAPIPKTGQIEKVDTDEPGGSKRRSVSRPITRRSTSPIQAVHVRSGFTIWTERRFATGSGLSSSTSPAPDSHRLPTASAATWMETSGQARGQGFRS